MGLGVSLLGVDEMRELGRVANEEDRGIVENPVEIAFVGANLDSEAPGVTSSVCGARLTADSRETDGKTSPVANCFEERGTCKIGDVMRHFKIAVGTSTLGMDL